MASNSVLKKQIKKYVNTADEKTLSIVHTILEASEDDNDPLLNMSKEQEESFLCGLADIKAGRVTPHEEVMKKYKKWLTK